ncbi:hypothetical protein BGZ63DRAFT_447654 [Mariannaea sp. PMI_226]|nr:hypothetical protein BGZ63DRAFT_447654 [Mariannaea sp. PMI_226]
MAHLADDAKTALKGIRGAGDAIRGEMLDAADRAFERDPNHPTSIATNAKNQAIREKGKADVRNVDEMFARHEWNRKKGVEGQGYQPPPNQPSAHEPPVHQPAMHQPQVNQPPAQAANTGTARFPVEHQPGHVEPQRGTVPNEPAMTTAQEAEPRTYRRPM